MIQDEVINMTESYEATLDPKVKRTAYLQLVILLLASLILFWPVWHFVIKNASTLPDAAHALAIPIMILILIWLRRHDLAQRITKGSVWGLVVILFGVLLYGISNWPFRYGYPEKVSCIIVITGIILATCGWRFLFRCLPFLFLLIIAIPTGSRTFARLIIAPETYTIEAVRLALELLPGITISLDGQDIFYYGKDGGGSIALGEPHRGARLFLAFLTICVFMTFIRVRPLWQIITLAILSIPVVLICNFARLALAGVITIYGNDEPASAVPRTVSSILALCLCYFIFGLLIIIINSLIVDPNNSHALTSSSTEQEENHGG